MDKKQISTRQFGTIVNTLKGQADRLNKLAEKLNIQGQISLNKHDKTLIRYSMIALIEDMQAEANWYILSNNLHAYEEITHEINQFADIITD